VDYVLQQLLEQSGLGIAAIAGAKWIRYYSNFWIKVDYLTSNCSKKVDWVHSKCCIKVDYVLQ
jgi:hypothetical protein